MGVNAISSSSQFAPTQQLKLDNDGDHDKGAIESSAAKTNNSAAYSVQISNNGKLRNAASSNTASTSSSTATSQMILTRYTNTQLKQMLSVGKITQSQYNVEVARRNKASEQAANTTNAATANTVTAEK